MKKLILLVAVVLTGCNNPISKSADVIHIGLANRNYNYVSIVTQESSGTYVHCGDIAEDTMWINVPNEDAVTLITYVNDNTILFDINPVKDSVYTLIK